MEKNILSRNGQLNDPSIQKIEDGEIGFIYELHNYTMYTDLTSRVHWTDGPAVIFKTGLGILFFIKDKKLSFKEWMIERKKWIDKK